MIPATSARNREPFSPSMCRWSKRQRQRGHVADHDLVLVASTTHGCFVIAPKQRIADSPGLMIGVPASTPKTPTLVIVNVPPVISAGWVLPSRAIAVSSPERAGQVDQREVLRRP